MATPHRSAQIAALQFIALCAVIVGLRFALSGERGEHQGAAAAASSAPATEEAPALSEMPAGYRDWRLVSVAFVGPPLNDIRAKLGNDIAITDFRQGTLPYRDGAIIVRLAWHQTHDPETDKAFELQAQQAGLSVEAIAKVIAGSAVAGAPTNVQFMVKDAKKYPLTGGWGFAQFTNGKPDPVVQNTCYACHAPAKDRDYVFTRYAN